MRMYEAEKYLTWIIPYIFKLSPYDGWGWAKIVQMFGMRCFYAALYSVTLWESKISATITKSLFPKHSTRSGPQHFQSKLGHWATRHRHPLFNFVPQLREETIFVYSTFTQSSFITFHIIYTWAYDADFF